MTIQKISAATSLKQSKNPQKIQSNNAQITSNSNETSLKGSEAIKNNFMSGISFKGYSKHVGIRVGTSGLMSIAEHAVPHPAYTSVRQGNRPYKQGYAGQEIDCLVYYADPQEPVTDEIRKNNTIIVEYDKKPQNISREEIDSAEKASTLRSIIDTLNVTVGILQAEDRSAAVQLGDAEEDFEKIRAQYESAKAVKEEKAKKKSKIEIELAENKDKLSIAQTKYETVKAKEEAEYRAEVKRRRLSEIQEQIANVNSDAEEQIKQIEAAKDAKLAELERQKKELLGEE